MRKEILFILGAGLLVILICAGIAGLASANMQPSLQHVHQVVPDVRIPH